MNDFLCRLFGHTTIPIRKHYREVGPLDGVHLYAWHCTRCKREVTKS